MSEEMVEGMFVFQRAGCAGCHVPPSFASSTFADRRVADVDGVDDFGRFEVTGDPADRNRYRVPTLRNVRESAPYFHTGAVADLGDAIRHEVNTAIELGESEPLDDEAVEALIAFVQKSLVDLSGVPDRPTSVPSGLPVPEDHSRILH
jgi:cytochrome c peroxidase